MIECLLFLLIGAKLGILKGWYLFLVILFGFIKALKWSIILVKTGSDL